MSKSSPPFVSATAHHAADPFRLLVESVVDYAIYTVDPARVIASWNPGAERIYGYRSEEIIGQSFSIVFAPDDVTAGRPDELWRLALEAGHHEFDGMRARKDKSQFWAIVTVSALKDHFGNHAGFSVVTRDVTEKRRAEQALRENEESHRRLLDFLPDAVFVNSDDRIAYCNSAFVQMLGAASSEALLGRPVLSIFHPKHHEVVRQRIETIQIHNGTVPLIEEEVVRLDGDVVPVEVAATAITHQGRSSVLVVLRDLRQRKDVERRFRAMIDGVKDYAIYTMTPDGVIATWNDGAARIFGYAADEILGRHRSLLFTAQDVAAGVPQAEQARAAAEGSASEERWRVRKDGSRFWANGVMTAIRDGSGVVRGYVKIVRDLTERRQAEAALKESEERYRSLFNAMADPLFVYDRETLAYLAVNDAAVRTYGYRRDEFAGMTIKDIRPVEDVPSLLTMLATAGHDLEDRGVWRHRKSDGTVMEVEISAHGMDYAGRPACVIQARDVTEKRRAAAEAAQTGILLQAVADGISDAVFVKDQAGKYLLFNKAAAAFVGKSIDEVLGKDDTALFDPDSARIAMESAIKTPYRDAEGNVLGVIGVSRDITERKRAEDSMRQQQALLRIAGRVARLGGWSLDLASQRVTWSEEICAIHEVPAGYQPSLENAIRFYPSEYREKVARLVHECTENGTSFDFELELLTAKERRVWVRAIGEAVRDDAGRIVSLQGAFQDISDRKKAQDEKQRLTERLATTLESITDGFFTIDPDWRFTFVNAEAERLILRRREDLIGITIWDAFPETLGASFEREYWRAREQNVTVDFEEYFPPLAKWFGVRAYPSEQGLAVYFRDVTTSRELTAELVNERSRLVAAQAVAKVGSWETDLSTMDVIWSAETYRIFEQAQDKFRPTHPRFLQLVHPEDRGAVDRAFQDSLQLHTPQTIEHRIVMPDGRIKFVEENWQVSLDQQGKPVRVTGTCQDITERKLAEEALRLRDRAIQAVSQGILITDPNQPDNPIIFASCGFERMTGYRSDDVIGKNCRFLQGNDTEREVIRELREAIAAARSCMVEILNYRKDGKPFWNQLTITPVLGPAGQLTHFVGVQTDVTERRRLEDQYRQSQKMEAVGRLAGGVAHDFNNLLTIISGYSELLLAMPSLASGVRESIRPISEAGERAASLTRQLLGFSRQTMLQPKVLDLNAIVAETGKMLRRLIGEDILLTTVLDPKISRVKVDPGQLDQVLMNLAVNARDAMPKGGKLTIETGNVTLDDNYAATHPDCKAGHYVLLAMSDTGCGMTPDVLARIFEPFFTTKEVGRGTGLGLAMVFGIIQQSGGCIHVYSEPSRGTTFKIYLPAVSEQLSVKRGSDSQHGLRGTETILLVEDDEGVRALALMSLKMHGYNVLATADGNDALRVAKSHCGLLHLILTDVVMPNVSGPELIVKIKTDFPGVKVLFMSGYTDDVVVRHGLIEADVAFIQKPYTPQGLARKVRQVLDEKSNADE
ncbi:MAG: PAS domain S-box protein [Planctomycetes bacterium]|nr:PAS domain S-box protein [Planctomycetota bacterium]